MLKNQFDQHPQRGNLQINGNWSQIQIHFSSVQGALNHRVLSFSLKMVAEEDIGGTIAEF
jgi:hypothetical protein